jgi:hypothetical protein
MRFDGSSESHKHPGLQKCSLWVGWELPAAYAAIPSDSCSNATPAAVVGNIIEVQREQLHEFCSRGRCTVWLDDESIHVRSTGAGRLPHIICMMQGTTHLGIASRHLHIIL